MLELDYAFLAEHASIQGKLLTTVGASFTRMETPSMPFQAFFAIAGRIRCDEPDQDTIGLTVRIISPGDTPFKIEAHHQLDSSESTNEPYNGHRRGIIFALQMSLPLLEEGTYTVEVDIDETDEVDRVLKFETVTATGPSAP